MAHPSWGEIAASWTPRFPVRNQRDGGGGPGPMGRAACTGFDPGTTAGEAGAQGTLPDQDAAWTVCGEGAHLCLPAL